MLPKLIIVNEVHPSSKYFSPCCRLLKLCCLFPKCYLLNTAAGGLTGPMTMFLFVKFVRHSRWCQTQQDTPTGPVSRAKSDPQLGGASMDWTCSCTSHGCLIRLGSGLGPRVSQQNIRMIKLFLPFVSGLNVFWLISVNDEKYKKYRLEPSSLLYYW